MAATPLRACLRCHTKKIKCTGYPECRSCSNLGVSCEAYKRIRKSEQLQTLRESTKRVKWLEDQILENWGIDCKNVPTDSPLQPGPDSTAPTSHHTTFLEDPSTVDSSSKPLQTPGSSELGSYAPELSLVALNATGDMRYLGPSSGAFFAAYATSLAGRFSLRQGFSSHCPSPSPADQSRGGDISNLHGSWLILPPRDARLLLESYEIWVHSLYPLMRIESLRSLVDRCMHLQSADTVGRILEFEANAEMSIFYLAMALGAINYSNTRKQLQIRGNSDYELSQEPSPGHLHSQALCYFDRNSQRLKPSVSAIQIVLLISIYSSYGPIESSQWQLVGLAMRMATEIGLHYSPRVCNPLETEADERSRAFWIAYAMEIQLAYNLGRPPSIGEEHITARMPQQTDDDASGIHHIKHRQIQNRIISQVYRVNYKTGIMTTDEKEILINSLQLELDTWRSEIPVDQSASTLPYPFSYWDRLYHSTSFVLHRSSPLCPRPLPSSLEKCIRSAGAYIDDILNILRHSNVPLCWMLVQGVLFAGLTMLITARTGFRQLASKTGLPFLLVDFPAWTRKCSICLAILNERWNEDVLVKLDAQFELLANDSLRIISSGLTSQSADCTSFTPTSMEITDKSPETLQRGNPPALEIVPADTTTGEEWENLDLFKEFLGIDEMQTFWDLFPESQEFTF